MKNIKITRLANGITVISEKKNYLKSFSLGFWFNVGSRDETAGNNGISHFLEHMFFKGTKTRSAKKMSEEIESLGGYLNAFTSKEHTCYYGRGLNEHIEKTFEVLADMIQNSVFRNSDIEKESAVVIDELKDIEDSPDELIFDKFESNIFKGNSVGFPIVGTEKNLKNFRRKDLFDYVKNNYSFNNLYIVASGCMEHSDLLRFTEKYIKKDLGHSQNKRSGVILSPSRDIHVFKESQQAHVIIGRPTFGYDNKKRNQISVLSHILGEGSSSRLFQVVREENGIAYQINTFLNSFLDVSTFGVYFSTGDKSVHKAQDLIFSEFNKIKRKKISETELNRAKEYLIGNIIMGQENTTNRMVRLAQSMIYFNRIKTIDETIKIIRNTSRETILELANEIFEENSLKRVILSSKNLLLHKAA